MTDLNDVITTHWVMSPEPTPLQLYGPPRLQEVVDGLLRDVGARHQLPARAPPRPELGTGGGGHRGRSGRRVRRRLRAVSRSARRITDPVEPTVAFRSSRSGGASVVLGGDGVPARGSTSCARAPTRTCRPCCAKTSSAWCPTRGFQDILDYHSSVEDAARTATKAGVGTLVLTHYIPGLAAGPGAGVEGDGRGALRGRPSSLGDDLTAIEL